MLLTPDVSTEAQGCEGARRIAKGSWKKEFGSAVMVKHGCTFLFSGAYMQKTGNSIFHGEAGRVYNGRYILNCRHTILISCRTI
jgi:hypothetical protein